MSLLPTRPPIRKNAKRRRRGYVHILDAAEAAVGEGHDDDDDDDDDRARATASCPARRPKTTHSRRELPPV